MTSRRHPVLGLGALVLIGGFAALQTRINGELAKQLGTGLRAGIGAALISFLTGLVLLSVIVGVQGQQRAALKRLWLLARGNTLPRWYLFGGLGGALVVAAQGLTAATLGVALFTVSMVAGQTTSALGVDKYGLGPRGVQRINALRILAAACTLFAVGLTVSGKVGAASGLSATALLLVLLPFAAGAGSSVQQAINGRVSHHTSAWVATWNNFAVGSVVLTFLLLISLCFPGEFKGLPANPLLYLGGVIGVGFIAVSAVLVHRFGVLLLSLCTIAGQVSIAAVLDVFNAEIAVGWTTFVGAGITLVGIALAMFGSSAGPKVKPAK